MIDMTDYIAPPTKPERKKMVKHYNCTISSWLKRTECGHEQKDGTCQPRYKTVEEINNRCEELSKVTK